PAVPRCVSHSFGFETAIPSRTLTLPVLNRFRVDCKDKINPCWVCSVPVLPDLLQKVAFPAKHPKILGDTIREYRAKAGLSQEQLAEKANLHPVYVGKIERGEQWISLHALLRVAAALKVRVRDLVDRL
ncbi:MAG TPA: helix-turn-helix transcriptional regulator, partial [Candidatus Acidoferrum sp.]|nr:helix-turn-helix transcriptional regulator [Candidatus Acidoferrum sp.]